MQPNATIQDTQTQEHFETDMDDMRDGFYIIDIYKRPSNCPMEHVHHLPSHIEECRTKHTFKEEIELKKLSCLPLYIDTQISMLYTFLSIFNLQSILGWLDTSVFLCN